MHDYEMNTISTKLQCKRWYMKENLPYSKTLKICLDEQAYTLKSSNLNLLSQKRQRNKTSQTDHHLPVPACPWSGLLSIALGMTSRFSSVTLDAAVAPSVS